jgi:hypothetical protein
MKLLEVARTLLFPCRDAFGFLLKTGRFDPLSFLAQIVLDHNIARMGTVRVSVRLGDRKESGHKTEEQPSGVFGSRDWGGEWIRVHGSEFAASAGRFQN